MLEPVGRKSLSDAVFYQLRDAILHGELAPDETLPAERVLCSTLGVSRPALREAMARLAHAGLVQVRHGDKTRVADWRKSAGLDLLPHLLGTLPSPELLRGALELRAALAPDVARKCAERSPEAATKLQALLDEMRGALDRDDPPLQLRALNIRFWTVLVEGSQNIAYQLAYNSLMRVVDADDAQVAVLLAAEFRNHQGFKEIARCVTDGDGEGAESAARAHIAIFMLA